MVTLFLLYWIFLKVSLLTFGGGYAMVSVFFDELVTQRGMMKAEEFADLVSLAQMTPGPIGLNSATHIGVTQAGIPGAVSATLGVVTPSLILGGLVMISLKSFQENPWVKRILSGIRPVTVGLVAAAVLFFAESSVFIMRFRDLWSKNGQSFGVDALGLAVFLGALCVAWRRNINPVWVMLGGGFAGMAWMMILRGLYALKGGFF